jgi:hypothetical protein
MILRRMKKSDPFGASKMRAMINPLMTKNTSTPNVPKAFIPGNLKPVWKNTTAVAANALSN